MWIPYVDMNYVYFLTPVYFKAMFTCSRCNHSWYQRKSEPPRRCPNHKCRSVYWNTTAPLPPLAVSNKLKDLADLRELLVAPKPKENKIVTPSIPPTVVDQPDFYSEPTVNYD